jgi:general stress protein YciG
MADTDNGGMSVREAGRKGGKTVSERYSHEHFQNIGRKGGRKVAELIDRAKRMDESGSSSS